MRQFQRHFLLDGSKCVANGKISGFHNDDTLTFKHCTLRVDLELERFLKPFSFQQKWCDYIFGRHCQSLDLQTIKIREKGSRRVRTHFSCSLRLLSTLVPFFFAKCSSSVTNHDWQCIWNISHEASKLLRDWQLYEDFFVSWCSLSLMWVVPPRVFVKVHWRVKLKKTCAIYQRIKSPVEDSLWWLTWSTKGFNEC